MDEGPESQDETPPETHLDSRRISRLATIRRSAYRSRSYCLIGSIGSIVGSAEFIYLAAHRLHQWVILLDILGAIALLRLGWIFLKWARQYQREARQAIDPPLDHPPDFSTLSDGTQVAQNLHRISDEDNSPII